MTSSANKYFIMRGGVSGGREGSGGRGGYGLAVTEGTHRSDFIWMFHSFSIKLVTASGRNDGIRQNRIFKIECVSNSKSARKLKLEKQCAIQRSKRRTCKKFAGLLA